MRGALVMMSVSSGFQGMSIQNVQAMLDHFVLGEPSVKVTSCFLPVLASSSDRCTDVALGISKLSFNCDHV